MDNGFIIKTSRLNNRNLVAKHDKNKGGFHKSKKGKAAYTKTSRNAWKREINW